VSLSSLPTPQITSPSTSTYIPYEIQRRFPLPPATLGAIFSSSAVSNSVRLDSSAAHPPTGVASACNRNLSSPHVESILLILTCLFRPIYHTSLVLISPVLVLLIGADSHQRDTVPVPPLLHITFRFTPFIAPLLFPCPPLRQRSSAFCPRHISCSTYATYSICGCRYAGKVVITFSRHCVWTVDPLTFLAFVEPFCRPSLFLSN
jgi:hypothetical protein